MRLSTFALGLASLVATFAVSEGAARADAAGAAAPEQCRVALSTSLQGLRLPANAPSLLVLARSGNSTPKDAVLASDAESRPLGALGTDTHGLLHLPLPQPAAAPGTYTVRYGVACTDRSPSEQGISVPLEIVAPVDFPTQTGTLTHTPEATPTGVEKVVLTPSPELRAFFDVAALDATIDGVATRHLGHTHDQQTVELQVNAGDACIVDGALHREVRNLTVSVTASLAGRAEQPAPAVIQVPFDCGAVKWTDLELSGGGSSSGGSSGSSGGSSSGGGTGGEGEGTEAGGGASCSAAPFGQTPASRSNGVMALGVAGAFGLVLARRRRRA